MTSPQTRQKILSIDDDAQMRKIMRKALEEDYEFLEASSGPVGIRLAQAERPDLILLDVMMPDMDGYEVCQELREDPKTACIPVLMVTALGTLGDRIHGLDYGADDYIAKPFFKEELRSRVTAHLRRSARDVNTSPLTNLPGNTVIEQVIRSRLERRQPLAVLYTDASNFKEYNDEYGWLKGDSVIKQMAQVITDAIATDGGNKDFVGHIGGDDFVVVSTPERAEPIAQKIIAQFDAAIPSYYSEEARQQRYLDTLDRRGHPTRIPLMTLAVAIISSERQELKHPEQIATLAAELKRHIKSLPGSQYAFDRRQK
jgi:diguanylate cyclase (GGDEF)-like protein